MAPSTPLPTLEDALAIWRGLDTTVYRLEDAWLLEIAARGYELRELSWLRHELEEAGRDDELIELAREVLASGAEFPGNWTPPLAERLIAADRLDEAEPVVRDIVANLEPYKSEMLTCAMAYHRARGDTAIEAMLYHAGRRWFTSFKHEFSPDEAASYGPRPRDLPAQFARWLESWVGTTAWEPIRSARLGHWLTWFADIGERWFPSLVAAFEHEREQRAALCEALKVAPDEAAARQLADQIMQRPGDPELIVRAAHGVMPRAPVVAYDLLLHAIRGERRNGYRYRDGDRVVAVVLLTYLPLNHAALADRIAEAYAIGRGYARTSNPNLHFNLACCAARLGRRDAAIGHAAHALARDFPSPRQIHDDNDLEPLRGDPQFEQIFVDDAARRAAEAAAAAAAVRTQQDREANKRANAQAASRGTKAQTASKRAKAGAQAASTVRPKEASNASSGQASMVKSRAARASPKPARSPKR